MRSLVLVVLSLLVSIKALAAGGSSAGLTPEVWAFIKLQLMNFGVFAALIFFLSRSKIAPVFRQFKEDYINKSQAAQRKLEEAKAERDDLAYKLEKLEKEHDENISKAEQQAEVKYNAKLVDVKSSIQTMNKDLEGQIENLKRSQAAKLKDLLMEKSIQELKADFGSDVDEALLMKLQNSFVESVVRV